MIDQNGLHAEITAADGCLRFQLRYRRTNCWLIGGSNLILTESVTPNVQMLMDNLLSNLRRAKFCKYYAIRSVPTHFCSTSGTRMLPSACWQFSRMAINARETATAVPLSVWTNCVPFVCCDLQRMPNLRA